MKIDDQPIPREVKQAWKKSVTQATPAAIRALASLDKEIHTGYRGAGKVDLAVAQKRILNRLDHLQELPTAYRALLAGTTLFSSLVNVLSEQALVQLEVQWCHYFGRTEMVAAMLLDERKAVRTLAQNWWATLPTDDLTAGSSNSSSNTRRAAAQALQAELIPLLAHLHKLVSDTAEPDMVPTSAIVKAPEVHHNKLQEQQLLQSVHDKEIKHLRRELHLVLAQCERQGHALESTQRALQAANVCAAKACTDLAALQSEWDARIQQRVEALLDERLLPWLRPAEALADQVSALYQHQPPFSFIEQAQALLQKQATSDRQHGLRSQLRAELAGCQEACAQLELAHHDALRPLPELATMVQKLQARTQQIEKILQTGTKALPANPLLYSIAQTLACATDLEAIAAVRRALQASEALGWLQQQAQEQAYQLIDEASAKIYAVAGAVQRNDKNRARLRVLPLRAMQAELADQRNAMLVVDGHNILYTQTAHFKALYEEGRPGAKARYDLGQKLVALGRCYPQLTIHLWFDGDFPADKTLSANVREYYSGGQGVDRADQCIVAYLRHFQAKTPALMRAVVTGDLNEGVQAERTGALVMAPPELMLWLRPPPVC